MKKRPASTLDERVEFQLWTTDGVDDDPLSDGTQSFVPQFSRWADVKPMRGFRETAQGEAVVAVGQFEVRVRQDSETNTIRPENWRALWNGEYLNIEGKIDPDGRSAFWTMQAVRGLPS